MKRKSAGDIGQEALIYCCAKTTSDSDDQETVCRTYAVANQLIVIRVICDQPGLVHPRPGVTTILDTIRDRKRPIIVIVDDLSRISRNVSGYKRVGNDLAAVGGIIKSATMDPVIDHVRRRGIK